MKKFKDVDNQLDIYRKICYKIVYTSCLDLTGAWATFQVV